MPKNNKSRKGIKLNTKHKHCNKLMQSLAKDIEHMRRDFGMETCIVYYPQGTMAPMGLPSGEAVDRATMRLFGPPLPPPPPPEVDITEGMFGEEERVWLENAVEEYLGGLGDWSEERRGRLKENLGRLRREEAMEDVSLEEWGELDVAFERLQERV
ncbi:hypothetical protein QJS10_CPA03g02147 [Acorus calamus]|uniref:MADS-box domain-containing protein n=1 Tax=Acorus calamus TaxID=4465 RepID=A0AAV9F9D0_ACOCL|nr:hypothetical protein QJS10_CPA03g02147 [Acorus calamus]